MQGASPSSVPAGRTHCRHSGGLVQSLSGTSDGGSISVIPRSLAGVNIVFRALSSLRSLLFTAVKPVIADCNSRAVLVDVNVACCACRRISWASSVASVRICLALASTSERSSWILSSRLDNDASENRCASTKSLPISTSVVSTFASAGQPTVGLLEPAL